MFFFLITPSSPHYPLCSTFCKALTCDEDTPSHELDFELTHGSEIIHYEEESKEIIEYPFHPLSF